MLFNVFDGYIHLAPPIGLVGGAVCGGVVGAAAADSAPEAFVGSACWSAFGALVGTAGAIVLPFMLVGGAIKIAARGASAAALQPPPPPQR